MTYGDKESWWFGLELSGVPYSFENHYGAVLGDVFKKDQRNVVCGFTIAHVDEKTRLIWFNGGLLKNKVVSKKEFQIPISWMVDGTWTKGKTKADMSCMTGADLKEISEEEKNVIKKSVELAQKADEEHSLV